jgi:hypothetical protein
MNQVALNAHVASVLHGCPVGRESGERFLPFSMGSDGHASGCHVLTFTAMGVLISAAEEYASSFGQPGSMPHPSHWKVNEPHEDNPAEQFCGKKMEESWRIFPLPLADIAVILGVANTGDVLTKRSGCNQGAGHKAQCDENATYMPTRRRSCTTAHTRRTNVAIPPAERTLTSDRNRKGKGGT